MDLLNLSEEEIDNLSIDQLRNVLLKHPEYVYLFPELFNREAGYPNNNVTLALQNKIDHNIELEDDFDHVIEQYRLSPIDKLIIQTNTQGRYSIPDEDLEKIEDIKLLANNRQYITNTKKLKDIAEYLFHNEPEQLKNNNIVSLLSDKQIKKLGIKIPLTITQKDFDFDFKGLKFDIFYTEEINEHVFTIRYKQDNILKFNVTMWREERILDITNIEKLDISFFTLCDLNSAGITNINGIIAFAATELNKRNNVDVFLFFKTTGKIPNELWFIEQQLEYTQTRFAVKPRKSELEPYLKKLGFKHSFGCWRLKK